MQQLNQKQLPLRLRNELRDIAHLADASLAKEQATIVKV
jgi:hypothetical protein